MKIGIDIDEVLAELVEHFIKYLNRTRGTSFKKEEISTYRLDKALMMADQEIENLFEEFHKSEEFLTLRAKEDSVNAIKKISETNNLHIITARPENIREQTESWLRKHFGNPFEEIHFTCERWNPEKKNKADICKELELEMMIEDNLDYALGIASEKTTVILMDAPWNKSRNLPKNIKRVKSWKEAEKIISKKQKNKQKQ